MTATSTFHPWFPDLDFEHRREVYYIAHSSVPNEGIKCLVWA